MNRRSFLAATVLAPFAGALAAENNLRIRIGQIGTSHSHAAGKMGALRALSHLYEVVGITMASSRTSPACFAEGRRWHGLPSTT